ncbi:sugar phosphate isomerase/epimerase family protein [Parapedobacter sp. DT-150]|uniref:sugar phosphate isomerase/epimerase family protein n=1 Tax=Parapedobacter sp. DT-150 TaxID=3396162 RepID=UPI003F1A1530
MKRLGKLLLVLTALCFSAFVYKGETVKKEEWKTGVALYSFHQHPLEAALTMAQKSGVKYVEGFSFYKLGAAFDNKSLGELDTKDTERVKSMLKQKGLEMTSLYVADAYNEVEWKKYFDLGKQYGVKYLVCEPRKEQWDLIDRLAGLYNIKVAIHEHKKGSSYYWHPDSVLKAIKGHPNIGACADIGHWVRSGLDPVQCLKMLDGHVLGLHLKDVDKNGNDVDLGAGAVNFPELIKELKRQQFDGYVQVECEHNAENNLEDVKEAIQYFNIATKNK